MIANFLPCLLGSILCAIIEPGMSIMIPFVFLYRYSEYSSLNFRDKGQRVFLIYSNDTKCSLRYVEFKTRNEKQETNLKKKVLNTIDLKLKHKNK